MKTKPAPGHVALFETADPSILKYGIPGFSSVLSIDFQTAIQHAINRRRPNDNKRHMARTPALQQDLSNAWLKSQGLVSIEDLWIKAQGCAT